MPKKRCWHCSNWIDSGKQATLTFYDGSRATDLRAVDIVRFAPNETDQHGPLAPQSDVLHRTCKSVLVEVRRAVAAQPEAPVTRQAAAAGSEPVHRPTPAKPKRRQDAAAKAVDLAREGVGETLLELPRRRQGRVDLLDCEAAAKLQAFEPDQLE